MPRHYCPIPRGAIRSPVPDVSQETDYSCGASSLQASGEAVCLIEAPDLMAVGEYYQDFTQVEDAEVIAALARSADRLSTMEH